MAEQKELHPTSKVNTTGHQWDDEDGAPLREWNNPLPKWWLYSFYATIAWAVVYWILYPAWPLATDYTRGVLGWSMHTQLKEEIDEARALQKPYLDKLAATPMEEIAKDPKLLAFAKSGGKAVFGDNCGPCHGSGGEGSKGFPSLVDDDWLYGGTLADINESVNYGRAPMMPAHLDSAGGAFTEPQVRDLTAYVVAISGGSAEAQAAERGKALFMGDAGCNNCHGDKGDGAVLGSVGDMKLDKSVGAPNLTDRIWLYGGDPETIYQTIAKGRAGKMPAWGEGWSGFGKKLDPLAVKQVVLYVHSLGGGK